MTDVLTFARRQGAVSDPNWERTVILRTLTWCLKDAPNVKIASGSNGEVARVVRKAFRMAPHVFLQPGLLARLLLAFSVPPAPLRTLRRWRHSHHPSPGFQLPLDHMTPTATRWARRS